MNEFFEFLNKMGGLHDSIVNKFSWNQAESVLEFHFENIYSNFVGLPEYPGLKPGTIILRGVNDISIDIDSHHPLRIFEFLPKADASCAVLVSFSPSGKICACFSIADYPPCELKEPKK